MSKKILVIDDEEDIRLFLSTLMTENGYDTMTASDGRQGYELAQSYQPDLILLDLMMPDQTGTDFCRRLRKIERFEDTPIIIVSGFSGRNYVLKNPAAVFNKPFDKAELVKAVQQAIGAEPQT